MKNDVQSIIIFGGSRGIGAAVARKFAEESFFVTIADVLDKDGLALVKSIGESKMQYVHCDVGKNSDINHAFDRVIERTGKVDVVLNNVGIARYGEIDVLSIEDWDLTFKINLTSQFLSCKRAVNEMKISGGGVIINTASILGHASQKTTVAYSASKAGVMGLTRTIAIDHAKDGIRCLSISPGTIDTPLVQIVAETFKDKTVESLRNEWAAHHPLNRLGTPEEIAATVFFLASSGAGFMTGSDVLIDGGIRSELYG